MIRVSPRLILEVYSGTTRIQDPKRELLTAQNLSFTTLYPGGIFGTLTFVVRRKIAEWWSVNSADRIVLLNGLQIIFEGKIESLNSTLSQPGQQVQITAVGGWGAVLMRRLLDKPWADNRLSDDVWVWQETAALASLVDVDRDNRIRVTPKNVAHGNNELCQFLYREPTGQLIRRVTCSYNLQEGAYAYELRMYDRQNSQNIWNVTASGSGTQDITLTTPSNNVALEFISRAAQTPPENGTVYGQVSDVVVYTETGSINLTEIATDIIGLVSDLNSTAIFIGSNTLSLVPFFTAGHKTMADILLMAASHGDASYNPWAVYLDHSELAPTPNGNPVLVVEQKPSLSDYDYIVRVEELETGAAFEKFYDDIWNWIIIQYNDPITGKPLFVSPDDNANLTNSASVSAYGQRDRLISTQTTSQTQAIQIGRRFLAEHKDPRYKASGQLQIKNRIKTKSGSFVPVSTVRSGKRVKVLNVTQMGDLSGDITMLISNTSYDHESQVISMDGGQIRII